MSQPNFACNPYALWKYITENTDYETAWIVKKNYYYDELNKRGIRCELYDSLAGNKLIEKADYVILNSYTFPNLPKRKNQIFVNLWHGSGIKAHDYYNHNLNPKHVKKLVEFADIIDLMCVQSLDDRFKLSSQLHFDLRKAYVTGQPRLDCIANSNGRQKLIKIYGDRINKYEKLIFFAPSFRANMSSHSGKFYSDNIFRLDDYDDDKLNSFLEKNNAAIVYKLHPVEQTAFKGRVFNMNSHCYYLDDQILFDNEVQYDEILNAFDVMISDYSSIAYDYLVLNKPIIYLLPDYEEYKSTKGFVFKHVDIFMPGEKAFCFAELISALNNAISNPDLYNEERENVLLQRFDYLDSNSAKRCYETIMSYVPIDDNFEIYQSDPKLLMPSCAEQIMPYSKDNNGNIYIIDSTKPIISYEETIDKIFQSTKTYYITSEIPNKYRRLSGKNGYKIYDLQFYYDILNNPKVEISLINGGVDFKRFSCYKNNFTSNTTRIGFAGTIDNRIYFAMVQFICEAFPQAEIIFAGDIIGDYPIWLDGYENLRYIPATYNELPQIISSFDVAILPYFGEHQKLIPSELFQYLACGKQVIASNMPNLPQSQAIYISESIDEAVANLKIALKNKECEDIIESAKKIARVNDWKYIYSNLINGVYQVKNED